MDLASAQRHEHTGFGAESFGLLKSRSCLAINSTHRA